MSPTYWLNKNNLKWQKSTLGKSYLTWTLIFSLDHVPSTNMEGAGLMTYTAAATRGRSRYFGFTFGELSWRPYLYTVYDSDIKLQRGLFQFQTVNSFLSFRWPVRFFFTWWNQDLRKIYQWCCFGLESYLNVNRFF